MCHHAGMTHLPSKEIDILELLRDGRHFSEKRGDMIHIIDSLTGNTVVLYTDSRTAHVPTTFVEAGLPSGVTVWTQTGVNPIAAMRKEIVYNPVTIDLICQKIAEGGSLTRICQEDGMPSYNTLCRWRRMHPQIDEQLMLARRDRAEFLRDSAMLEAATAEGRDPISGAQLRVDTFKWAAGVDDGKYSPKAKVEATITTPTQIIVHTGIDRATAEKEAVPVESEEVT